MGTWQARALAGTSSLLVCRGEGMLPSSSLSGVVVMVVGMAAAVVVFSMTAAHQCLLAAGGPPCTTLRCQVRWQARAERMEKLLLMDTRRRRRRGSARLRPSSCSGEGECECQRSTADMEDRINDGIAELDQMIPVASPPPISSPPSFLATPPRAAAPRLGFAMAEGRLLLGQSWAVMGSGGGSEEEEEEQEEQDQQMKLAGVGRVGHSLIIPICERSALSRPARTTYVYKQPIVRQESFPSCGGRQGVWWAGAIPTHRNFVYLRPARRCFNLRLPLLPLPGSSSRFYRIYTSSRLGSNISTTTLHSIILAHHGTAHASNLLF